MSFEDPTDFSTPIPLRGNETRPGEGERPNPWSRLEAVSSVRERLGWLAAELLAGAGDMAGAGAGPLVDALADELHEALWGDLAAVERVRRRIGRHQLVATWSAALGADGP